MFFKMNSVLNYSRELNLASVIIKRVDSVFSVQKRMTQSSKSQKDNVKMKNKEQREVYYSLPYNKPEFASIKFKSPQPLYVRKGEKDFMLYTHKSFQKAAATYCRYEADGLAEPKIIGRKFLYGPFLKKSEGVFATVSKCIVKKDWTKLQNICSEKTLKQIKDLSIRKPLPWRRWDEKDIYYSDITRLKVEKTEEEVTFYVRFIFLKDGADKRQKLDKQYSKFEHNDTFSDLISVFVRLYLQTVSIAALKIIMFFIESFHMKEIAESIPEHKDWRMPIMSLCMRYDRVFPSKLVKFREELYKQEKEQLKGQYTMILAIKCKDSKWSLEDVDIQENTNFYNYSYDPLIDELHHLYEKDESFLKYYF